MFYLGNSEDSKTERSYPTIMYAFRAYSFRDIKNDNGPLKENTPERRLFGEWEGLMDTEDDV
jgi:hypothetical protein